ncbi:uncharacterized protein LOC106383263 [Brassica napus]|uniref:uncharacterized protein LOC106383263 n=1 Tax=Brassica napus TaxID=3708 RepID=UPI00207AA75D|nr:uncharacterized protein LOC106383263 [Brassica napus]
MAPTQCMKAENIMLTMLIPGPTAPSNNIDVYLQPLIEDLKDLWTEDYPGLGTLAGCKVKGKQACNVCGKETPHRWLKFGRKHVYMGNRKRLMPGHPYRRRKGWFDNTVELGVSKRIQSGKKYLKADMPVRHNIDVMHVEKNVSDALLSILMNNEKSKDGLKARKDLQDMGIRSILHLEKRGKRTYLLPAAFWLSKEEKSMKSHDHHVLLQNLFPVALRGLLPKGPRIAVNRICNYFNRLCQRVIDPKKLLTLEAEIVETMCQLERFFPPSLFDIMFHLPLHLAKEARLGGPVHFRWIYPFERYMKTLKAYVKNFARPEAFQEAINRNEDIEATENVLEGRPLQKATEVTLTDKERETAHRYILMNAAVMDPYIELHLEELQATDERCTKNETLLWKYHTERFPQWIKDKIPNNSKEHLKRLRWLAFGPRNNAHTYKGYVVNGHRYHSDDVKRNTQNSGVTYEAFSMCRASAKDSKQMADMVAYYGVIKDIILLDYHMFQVPLFKCSWAHKGKRVKEEEGFTLVNLSMNQSSFANDPYILPSQAKQVFYSREDESSPWYIVMRAPPRGYHELETEERFDYEPSVQPIEDIGYQSDDESFCVRDDCEGVLVDV